MCMRHGWILEAQSGLNFCASVCAFGCGYIAGAMGSCDDDMDMDMDTGGGEWGEEERFETDDLAENEVIQDPGTGSQDARKKSTLGPQSGVRARRRSETSWEPTCGDEEMTSMYDMLLFFIRVD